MKYLKLFVILILLFLAAFGLYSLKTLLFPSFQNQNPTAQEPGLNLTALAAWTPTPNAPDQAKSIVATAWPTPVTRIIPADREAFLASFTQKLSAKAINWDLLSSLSHAGVAWRCTDMKLLDLSLPSSTSGSLVAVWATWYGGVDHTSMTIKVTDGDSLPPVANTTDNTLDIYHQARIEINFNHFGLIGPEILTGNEIALQVDKPSILYGVWMTPREWLTGEDLIAQKQTDNINFALDWAKTDSIAPLNKDGSRDDRYLKSLFKIAQANLDPNQVSVTLPDGQIVLTDHTLYQTLLDVALIAAKEAGYAGVQNLKVTIQEPTSLWEYHYLADQSIPVVPLDLSEELLNSTCPQVQLPADTILGINQVDLETSVKDGLFKRLLPLYQATP